MDSTKEDLYAQFFNHDKLVVQNMSNDEIRAWRKEMSDIAFRSKVGVQAADSELRERDANLSPSQREWLLTNTDVDVNVSDAIATVKVRKERMSKADKFKETVLGIPGISPELAEQMAKNIQKHQTSSYRVEQPKFIKSAVISALCQSDNHTDCPGRFNDGSSKTCECKCHNATAQASIIPSDSTIQPETEKQADALSFIDELFK